MCDKNQFLFALTFELTRFFHFRKNRSLDLCHEQLSSFAFLGDDPSISHTISPRLVTRKKYLYTKPFSLCVDLSHYTREIKKEKEKKNVPRNESCLHDLFTRYSDHCFTPLIIQSIIQTLRKITISFPFFSNC